MTDAIDKSKEAIAKVLVEQNVLSQAQVDLAYMDMEVQDLPFEDVLYMRGWITQEKLYELAPFLKPGYVAPAKQTAPKETLQKKIKERSKPAADEAPLVIALGAPKEEAADAPLIALGAPQEEAKEEIAAATPQEESPQAPVALAAPQEEAAAEAVTESANEAPPVAVNASSEEEHKEAEAEPAMSSTESAEMQKQTPLAEHKKDEELAEASQFFDKAEPDKTLEIQADSAPVSDPIFSAPSESGALFGTNDQSVDDLFNTLKSPAAKANARIEEPPTERLIKPEPKTAVKEESRPAAAKDEPKPKSQEKTESPVAEPKGIASTSSPRTEDEPEKNSDTTSSSTAKPKPTDIPGEPPLRSAEKPAVIQSPVEKSKEQSLKAYKEVLRKILTVEKK